MSAGGFPLKIPQISYLRGGVRQTLFCGILQGLAHNAALVLFPKIPRYRFFILRYRFEAKYSFEEREMEKSVRSPFCGVISLPSDDIEESDFYGLRFWQRRPLKRRRSLEVTEGEFASTPRTLRKLSYASASPATASLNCGSRRIARRNFENFRTILSIPSALKTGSRLS